MCEDKAEMLTTEKDLHSQFKEYNTSGEWFYRDPEILDYIQGNTESGQDILEEGNGEQSYNLRMPSGIYNELKFIGKLTGRTIASLIKEAILVFIAEQKKRANTLLVDAATLDALREYELDTGMPPTEQIQDAVAYWFRVKKVNRD